MKRKGERGGGKEEEQKRRRTGRRRTSRKSKKKKKKKKKNQKEGEEEGRGINNSIIINITTTRLRKELGHSAARLHLFSLQQNRTERQLSHTDRLRRLVVRRSCPVW